MNKNNDGNKIKYSLYFDKLTKFLKIFISKFSFQKFTSLFCFARSISILSMPFSLLLLLLFSSFTLLSSEEVTSTDISRKRTKKSWIVNVPGVVCLSKEILLLGELIKYSFMCMPLVLLTLC